MFPCGERGEIGGAHTAAQHAGIQSCLAAPSLWVQRLSSCTG